MDPMRAERQAVPAFVDLAIEYSFKMRRIFASPFSQMVINCPLS